MTIIRIEQVDGKDVATAIVEINLGEVRADSSEVHEVNGKKVQAISMPMHVGQMLRFYEQEIQESVLQDQPERFREAIQAYSQFHLLKQLGITMTPMKYDGDSLERIQGLAESVTVERV